MCNAVPDPTPTHVASHVATCHDSARVISIVTNLKICQRETPHPEERRAATRLEGWAADASGGTACLAHGSRREGPRGAAALLTMRRCAFTSYGTAPLDRAPSWRCLRR